MIKFRNAVIVKWVYSWAYGFLLMGLFSSCTSEEEILQIRSRVIAQNQTILSLLTDVSQRLENLSHDNELHGRQDSEIISSIQERYDRQRKSLDTYFEIAEVVRLECFNDDEDPFNITSVSLDPFEKEPISLIDYNINGYDSLPGFLKEKYESPYHLWQVLNFKIIECLESIPSEIPELFNGNLFKGSKDSFYIGRDSSDQLVLGNNAYVNRLDIQLGGKDIKIRGKYFPLTPLELTAILERPTWSLNPEVGETKLLYIENGQ